jgi:hypothetical protein
LAAGEPLTDDVIKCNLRPVSVGDYVVQPNAAQLTALRSIFPDGVCDYGRRGAEQRPAIGTWLEYPAPGQFEPVGEARDRDRD